MELSLMQGRSVEAGMPMDRVERWSEKSAGLAVALLREVALVGCVPDQDVLIALSSALVDRFKELDGILESDA